MNYIRKNDISKKNIFIILLFAGYIINNVVFIAFNSTSQRNSMILGLAICGFIFIIISKKNIFTMNKRYFLIIISMYAFITLQFILSRLIFADVDVSRFISSSLLIMILLFFSPVFANFMSLVDETSFDEVINSAYYFMTLIGFISLALIKFNLVNSKSMILFTEPSHFAFVYLPFLLYKVYSSTKNKKLIHLALALVLTISIENLTLFVGICLTVILVFWKNKRIIVGIVCAGFVAIKLASLANFIAYFIARLQITSDITNLTTLVWLSGWERAYLALINSYGLGVGFQQMGIVGEIGKYMYSMFVILGGKYLNLFDGGSTGAKLIAELGILGIILVIIYIIFFVRITKAFAGKKIYNNIELFFMSIYIMFSIQIFIRGIGYFSPSSFMFLVSIYWIAFKRNALKKKTNN